MIAILKWDSEFFNISIGECFLECNQDIYITGFDLIYIKSNQNISPKITGYFENFFETKVLFSKNIIYTTIDSNAIFSLESSNYEIADLYDLAFESGKYSRFKLDLKIGVHNFKKLYKTWVDNSVNKKFADDVVLYKNGNKTIGFVTYKIHSNYATIGLIAVSFDFQGKGIGGKMLRFVENKLLDKGIFELKIPTQLENVEACAFYAKQGYSICETTYIKHYWRDDSI